MKQSKKIIAMLLALVMLLSLAACGQKAEEGTAGEETATTFEFDGATYSYADYPKSDIVIAKINTASMNAWRSALMKNWEECCEQMKAVGLIKDYYTYNVDGAEAGMAAINECVAKGVDVVCMQASAESFGPTVMAGLEAGTKFIATGYCGLKDTLGDHLGKDFIVLDNDNDEYMRGPAEAICGMLDYEGQIIHIYGTDGAWPGGIIRIDAVNEVVDQYPGVKITHAEWGNWSGEKATGIINTLLAGYGDELAGQKVAVVGEDVGLAVLNAYLANGYSGKDLPIILGDYTVGFMRAWAEQPELKAVCNCYPADYAYTFAEAAYLMCQDKYSCTADEGYLIAPMPCVVVKDATGDEEWIKNLKPTTEVRKLEDVLEWANSKNLSDNDCIEGRFTFAEVADAWFK